MLVNKRFAFGLSLSKPFEYEARVGTDGKVEVEVTPGLWAKLEPGEYHIDTAPAYAFEVTWYATEQVSMKGDDLMDAYKKVKARRGPNLKNVTFSDPTANCLGRVA